MPDAAIQHGDHDWIARLLSNILILLLLSFSNRVRRSSMKPGRGVSSERVEAPIVDISFEAFLSLRLSILPS
jgi:hypothetical protein